MVGILKAFRSTRNSLTAAVIFALLRSIRNPGQQRQRIQVRGLKGRNRNTTFHRCYDCIRGKFKMITCKLSPVTKHKKKFIFHAKSNNRVVRSLFPTPPGTLGTFPLVHSISLVASKVPIMGKERETRKCSSPGAL
jgi:hypothetical protein